MFYPAGAPKEGLPPGFLEHLAVPSHGKARFFPLSGRNRYLTAIKQHALATVGAARCFK